MYLIILLKFILVFMEKNRIDIIETLISSKYYCLLINILIYINLYILIFPFSSILQIKVDDRKDKTSQYIKTKQIKDSSKDILIYNEQLDKGITKYKPLSLFFFKYIEILNNFKKSLNLQKSKNV